MTKLLLFKFLMTTDHISQLCTTGRDVTSRKLTVFYKQINVSIHSFLIKLVMQQKSYSAEIKAEFASKHSTLSGLKKLIQTC